MSSSDLAPELKKIVGSSVALLGEVILREGGSATYQRIENIRREMTRFRERDANQNFQALLSLWNELEPLKKGERHQVALAFTLMLELINACENAYRNWRLRDRVYSLAPRENPTLIYVMTAHPTEARAPQSIEVFHQIQLVLTQSLAHPEKPVAELLRHWLEIAWRTELVRNQAPRVQDEADHIYSTFFRPDIIESLLDFAEERADFFVRTWVGGDKDGHPGVDEKTLLKSLSLSRARLIELCETHLNRIRESLHLFPSQGLLSELKKTETSLKALRRLQSGDAKRVRRLRSQLAVLEERYREVLNSAHPSLLRLRKILTIFPGFVVPLELRESSDVLMEPSTKPKAIEKMLAMVARLSKDGDPRWYARGFIVSMTDSIEHLRQAGRCQKKAFGRLAIPIIPLFEESSSLADSENIVRGMIEDKAIAQAARKQWDGKLELMVGYSDSSKEAGVLFSRVGIANALPRLEKLCTEAKLTPVFFHGSGGSVDRGGGSIEDQTAWWPRSALRFYKVTVQGEMVERSLASPAIARGQLEHILESVERGLLHGASPTPTDGLRKFAARVSASYRAQITSKEFLEIVEHATPYSYLRFLKIGSRPTKRTTTLTVAGLRAIPWILCWTQTRVLFPTWWGVGSAWKNLSALERERLRDSYRSEPVFNSYIKALGFTLAKIDLAIWHLYLAKSALGSERAESVYRDFAAELSLCEKFLQDLTGEKEPLWFKPWLAESISLRSPMIHPLNILQILAERDRDAHLLRLSVTGISSGMLTTG